MNNNDYYRIFRGVYNNNNNNSPFQANNNDHDHWWLLIFTLDSHDDDTNDWNKKKQSEFLAESSHVWLAEFFFTFHVHLQIELKKKQQTTKRDVLLAKKKNE